MGTQKEVFCTSCGLGAGSQGSEESVKSLKSTGLIWLVILAIGLSVLGCGSSNRFGAIEAGAHIGLVALVTFLAGSCDVPCSYDGPVPGSEYQE